MYVYSNFVNGISWITYRMSGAYKGLFRILLYRNWLHKMRPNSIFRVLTSTGIHPLHFQIKYSVPATHSFRRVIPSLPQLPDQRTSLPSCTWRSSPDFWPTVTQNVFSCHICVFSLCTTVLPQVLIDQFHSTYICSIFSIWHRSRNGRMMYENVLLVYHTGCWRTYGNKQAFQIPFQLHPFVEWIPIATTICQLLAYVARP